MTNFHQIRVAVNGYGVIGKRVADAMVAQQDMTLAGIADVATDWRVAVVRKKGYTLYAATPEHAHAMRDTGLDPAGVIWNASPGGLEPDLVQCGWGSPPACDIVGARTPAVRRR